MSIEAMAWALNVPVGGNAKVVLIGLANHSHADGTHAFPSLATLARYANCDRSTAKRNVHKLAEAGWITPDGVGPNGQVNYRLNLEGGQNAPGAPVPREGGAPVPPEPSIEPLPLSENEREVGPELTSAVSLGEQLVAHEGAREGDSTEIPVTLWGKRVPPGIVQDATRALAHFAAQTAQTIRPYTGAGKPTDDLRLICRAMMDHPEARTMWRRMIDRAVSDPWWNGEPSAGVIFSPKMVQRSLAAARASGLRPVNGHGLTPSGRAIAKLLAADAG